MSSNMFNILQVVKPLYSDSSAFGDIFVGFLVDVAVFSLKAYKLSAINDSLITSQNCRATDKCPSRLRL